jgi:hypothetical protein
MKTVYGHILRATDHITSTYWVPVVMDPGAAAALSQFYCGDDRASHLPRVYVRTRRDAEELVRIALAKTGRLSAIRAA